MIGDSSNSLCEFSFVNENSLKLLTCRHPIKLNTYWSLVENKKIEKENNHIHVAVSVSNLKEMSFLMKFKLKNDFEKIQLFKQGTTDLNGVIDAWIENKDIQTLNMKLYYNFRNRNSIKVEKISIPLKNDYRKDFHLLCISINSKSFRVNVFENQDFTDYELLNVNNVMNNSLNVAYNKNNETDHLIIGDENIDFKYFGLFLNSLTPLNFSDLVICQDQQH